ncbi:YceH family protein [Uliginosibacterium sp. sgz301328]|uniref:YceH family protein n=1 Tax=Uliginosibacterium sp. sgz301328 TaxID=3243764 RepID=UPI00359EAC69
MPVPLLSALEARILGVLVEKQRTVPDTYPLSVNALASGCNQKTSRDPVMNASEGEILSAIDSLRAQTLVIESSGSRVARYAHNMDRVLHVPSQSVALLATLMLRGPQTTAELRANSERLHKFADASSVEAFLEELAERADGALVMMLPRAPGSRESRWTHLLSGEPDLSAMAVAAPAAAGPAGPLAERVEALEAEVSRLREQLARVMTELGIEA